MSKTKCGLYLRCSTKKAEQEASIEQQHHELARLAQKLDLEIVVACLDNGVSGTTSEKREGFKQMFELAKSGACSTWLVYDFSRFGRFTDPMEAFYWLFRLKKLGARVIFADEGNAEGMVAELMRVFQAFMASQYSAQLGKTVSRGMQHAKQQGLWATGKPPYGWRIGPNAITGRASRLVPGKPSEVNALWKMEDLRTRGKSWGDIASHLNMNTHVYSLPSSGKLWNKTSARRAWERFADSQDVSLVLPHLPAPKGPLP